MMQRVHAKNVGRLYGRRCTWSTRTPISRSVAGRQRFAAISDGWPRGRAPAEPRRSGTRQRRSVVTGCVPGPGRGQYRARWRCGWAAAKAGPGSTVQRNCASGMQALESAALDIAGGRSHLVLAGGTEAMSHHPVMLNELDDRVAGHVESGGDTEKARGRALLQLRPAHFRLVVALLRGLTDRWWACRWDRPPKLAERFGSRVRHGRLMHCAATSAPGERRRPALAGRSSRLYDGNGII